MLKKTGEIPLNLRRSIYKGEPETTRVSMIRPKKIILVVIDTLRINHLRCYGYRRNTSLNLDKLCKESVRFKHAFRPPFLPCRLMHRYSNQNTQIIFPKASVRFEKIRRKYDDEMTSTEMNRPRELIRDESEMNSKALRWIEENKNRDFFVFLHYFDVHGPYSPPEPYNDYFIDDEYDGAQKNDINTVLDAQSLDDIPYYKVLKHIRSILGSSNHKIQKKSWKVAPGIVKT